MNREWQMKQELDRWKRPTGYYILVSPSGYKTRPIAGIKSAEAALRSWKEGTKS